MPYQTRTHWQRTHGRPRPIRAPRAPDERGSAASRGYDARWRRVRLMKLAADPLCEMHRRAGAVVPATLVDHIVPIAEGGARLDMANLQSLCRNCHASKTHAESRAKP